jgi:hypothetical protein
LISLTLAAGFDGIIRTNTGVIRTLFGRLIATLQSQVRRAKALDALVIEVTDDPYAGATIFVVERLDEASAYRAFP